MKAFLAIIQEQFPQIWDLYCKIDNKIKFYFKTFLAKPMTKFFKINEKPYFGVILEHIWVFGPYGIIQKNFSNNCSDTTAFTCQWYQVDWPSNQKLFHQYQYGKIIQSIHSFNLLNSSFVRYTWFRNPTVYKTSPFLTMPTQ